MQETLIKGSGIPLAIELSVDRSIRSQFNYNNSKQEVQSCVLAHFHSGPQESIKKPKIVLLFRKSNFKKNSL